MERVGVTVRAVKALGLETCTTLGMLDGEQARASAESDLAYYNRNLDTSPGFYGRINNLVQVPSTNFIFFGDSLLMTANLQAARNRMLFEHLGLRAST